MPSFREIFPDKWLKPAVIAGHRPRVVIEHIEVVEVFNPAAKRHQRKLAVKFYGKEKRLLLNKTQCLALAAICRTDDYDDWHGFEVVLSVSKAPNGSDTIVISPVPDQPVYAPAEETA